MEILLVQREGLEGKVDKKGENGMDIDIMSADEQRLIHLQTSVCGGSWCSVMEKVLHGELGSLSLTSLLLV